MADGWNVAYPNRSIHSSPAQRCFDQNCITTTSSIFAPKMNLERDENLLTSKRIMSLNICKLM